METMDTRSQIARVSSTGKLVDGDHVTPAVNRAATPVCNVPLSDSDLRMVLARHTAPTWPLEKLVALCREWPTGAKASAIGTRLGTTKHAIIGKVHRLAVAGILTLRPNPKIPLPDSPLTRWAHKAREFRERAKGAPLRQYTRHGTPTAPATPIPKRLVPTALNRPLASVPKPAPVVRPPVVRPPPVAYVAPHLGRVTECCWPIGEPGTRQFHFCDCPSEPGRPYCEEHVKVAYVHIRGHAALLAGSGAGLSGAAS